MPFYQNLDDTKFSITIKGKEYKCVDYKTGVTGKDDMEYFKYLIGGNTLILFKRERDRWGCLLGAYYKIGNATFDSLNESQNIVRDGWATAFIQELSELDETFEYMAHKPSFGFFS